MKSPNQFEQLINQLNKRNQQQLQAPKRLKSSLFENLNSNDYIPSSTRTLVSQLKKLSKPSIAADRKAIIKEQILQKIQSPTKLFQFWHYTKKATLASSIIFIMLLTYIFSYQSIIFEIETATATHIKELNGQAFIIRDGQRLTAVPNMLLQENDIIYTTEDSQLEIQYQDNSISRLNEKTTIELKKLFAHSKKSSFTVIEVDLIEGSLWNRVFTLIDDSSKFKVNSKDLSTETNKIAAFNINSKRNGETRVQVIQNQVAVEKKLNNEIPTTIPAGFSVKVHDTKKIVVTQQAKQNTSNQEKDWIKNNLAEDQKDIETFITEKITQAENEIGSLPETPLYQLKEIKSDAAILMTNNEFEKEALKFDIANRRLQEAQILLTKGQIEPAEEILEEYPHEVKKFSNYIDTLKQEEPSKALELEIKLNDTIDNNLKTLAPITDESPLFKAKQVIEKGEQIAKKSAPEPSVKKENSPPSIEKTIPTYTQPLNQELPHRSETIPAQTQSSSQQEKKN